MDAPSPVHTPSGPPLLEMSNITMRFGEVVANENVTLDLREGEVHCLLGENGAGKSTLMNILYGLYDPTEGQVLINGSPVQIDGPKQAIELGIGMVHQHFMLIPVFTVAENIVLGAEPTKGQVLDLESAYREVEEISREYGLTVDPRARVEDISVGQQQRAEILKALYRGAKILILDEPTAVLTPQEADELMNILRALREQGVAIIFITHKLREVLEIADRISVLRRGKMIGTVPREGATEDSLAKLMVGRDVVLKVDKTPAMPERPVLKVDGVWAKDSRGLDAVRGATFNVHAGEIVGIAGIDGNGQSELIEAIAGLHHVEGGEIYLDGEPCANASPHEVSSLGLAHVPEDRHHRGLILDFDLAENLILHDYDSPEIARMGVIDDRAVQERATRLLDEFDVRGGGPDAAARGLSGGNQQKVVIAREIQRDPKLLIVAQPTRGVDIGAIEFIHNRIVEERDAGKAVLLVSFELDEILNLSDRILVMYEGEMVAEFLAGEADEQKLGIAMTGGGRAHGGPA